MLRYKKTGWVLLLSALIGGTSCKKELERVNKNPNNLESVDPTTLLSNIEVSEFYNNASIAWSLGNGYNQYMTFSQDYYNHPTRYVPQSNEPYWDVLFENARDADLLYNSAVSTGNTGLQAIALTLRSYAFAQLTELWGDIPFKNALQGNEENFTPSYDNQQTVYTDDAMGVLPSLRRADSLMAAVTAITVNGDVLYSSSRTNWRGFINALRLRYLMRVSGKMNVAAEVQTIVSANALMSSTAGSAKLVLPTTIPYNFPSTSERSGDFAVKFMNSLLYNTYQATGDSLRIKAYFSYNSNSATQTGFNWSYYGGMPMVSGDASATLVSTSSVFNSNFNAAGSGAGATANSAVLNAHIITFAEQELLLAEAALNSYITGDAATYYNTGVTAAFTELGLTPGAYLAHTGVAYTGTLEQIITQKWLLNVNNAFEGWIEYRRTGYPAFATGGAANLNNGLIPNRFLYPDTEKSINAANYNAELKAMGGTETADYKAWW